MKTDDKVCLVILLVFAMVMGVMIALIVNDRIEKVAAFGAGYEQVTLPGEHGYAWAKVRP